MFDCFNIILFKYLDQVIQLKSIVRTVHYPIWKSNNRCQIDIPHTHIHCHWLNRASTGTMSFNEKLQS